MVDIIDIYSRYILSWRLSNTLDADFYIEALEEALKKGNRKYSIPTREPSLPVRYSLT